MSGATAPATSPARTTAPPSPIPTVGSGRRVGRHVGTTLTWVWIVFSAFPFVFMVTSAFKTRTDATSIPPRWVFQPTLESFSQAWNGTQGSPEFRQLILNSTILTASVTVLTLAVGVLAAYALTLRHFGPRRFLSSWVLSTYMFPAVVAIVPVYYVENRLGLLGTYPGLVVPMVAFNLPIVIWLVRRGIQEVPYEIDEAARLDGASTLRILWSVVLPLLGPVIVTAGILTAILTWNEFLFASSLGSGSTQTAPSALLSFTGQYGTQYNILSAASLMVTAPVVVLAFVLRRRLVSGLTLGAVK